MNGVEHVLAESRCIGSLRGVCACGAVVTARSCSLCDDYFEKLGSPMQIEWEPGSVEIGDFSWCSFVPIVTDAARRKLQHAGIGAKFSAVRVRSPSDRRTRGRVRSPYAGPRLYRLHARTELMIDEAASALAMQRYCERKVCGMSRLRYRASRLVVRTPPSQAPLLFEVRQYQPDSALYVSDEGKALIESIGLSNLRFTRVGHLESH
jgi:hypothetical protein